ncbi:MAG: hypothetical protein OXC44_06260 [Proteobacteria bacterium]|nr:hypothetical protein [Pseudomonadota bacterium]
MSINKKSSKAQSLEGKKHIIIMLRVFALQGQIVLLGIATWYAMDLADTHYPLQLSSKSLPWGILGFPLWVALCFYLSYRAFKI